MDELKGEIKDKITAENRQQIEELLMILRSIIGEDHLGDHTLTVLHKKL